MQSGMHACIPESKLPIAQATQPFTKPLILVIAICNSTSRFRLDCLRAQARSRTLLTKLLQISLLRTALAVIGFRSTPVRCFVFLTNLPHAAIMSEGDVQPPQMVVAEAHNTGEHH